MTEFQIDDAYLTSVTIRKEWSLYDNIPRDKLTHEQLINILTGKDRCSSTSTDDHPEFSKFRDQLEKDGYIMKGPKWNADRVLKPFKVNEYAFEKGERFPSASALSIYIYMHKKRAELNDIEI